MKKFNIRKILADRGLSPDERRAVLEGLFVFGKDKQLPYLIRMGVLLVLSTIIATAGLISDSAAVVIGAMLVAPLMNPVMAAAGAVVMGWQNRFYASLWMIFLMGLGALGISSLITWLSPELVFIPEQVLARTRPTYYDLLIALAAGSAGAYTLTSKDSSAIPGVAVAVALLPPLASAGILVTTGETELAVRAVVLFLTNLVAMVLAGSLTFILVGVSPVAARKKSAKFVYTQLFLFLLLTVAISVPLWFYSEKILFNAHYQAAKSDVLQQWLHENQLTLTDIDLFEESRTVALELEGPDPPINIGELHQKLEAAAEDEHPLPLRIKYTWTQKVTGTWPASGDAIEQAAQRIKANSDELMGQAWAWRLTQHDADTATKPSSDDVYTLVFESTSKFRVQADCGSWSGKYKLGANFLDLNMNRNWLSGCRGNDILELFLNELEQATNAYIKDDKLQITLSGSHGVIHFTRE
jgi:uncharacterized hydrophobic protein (TIGR00271 family)